MTSSAADRSAAPAGQPAGSDAPQDPRSPGDARAAWTGAGIVAGLFGVALSWCAAAMLQVADNPVAAVAEQTVRLLPGPVAEFGIDLLGTADKPVFVVLILLVLAALCGWLGRLRRHGRIGPLTGFVVLAAVGGAAVLAQDGGWRPLVPVGAGLLGWIGALEVLSDPLRRTPVRRRGFLVAAGVLAVGAAALAVSGRLITGRRQVEEARRLLHLDGVTVPEVPTGVDPSAPVPWLTPAEEFYRIDTAFSPPAIDPDAWRLRVHGLVDRPVELSLADLMARELTEAWVTLSCVSNSVGGDLVGNAWWSGVRIATLLAELGVRPDADAVLQTSEDGWTCLTPLGALTDERNALLAVAMNGEPLSIEHGFPVRMVVPGLYGYVSATKWLVELEVTRFSDAEGYWTSRGWSAHGPVKLTSRIDVPASGETVPAGEVHLAGTAWQQHTGVEGVEVQVDGGGWQPADLALEPTVDSWVQWRLAVDLEPGEHRVAVRAISRTGDVQTGVERDVVPDGATGWHTVTFQVE